MLGLSTEQRTAIEQRGLMLRFFVWNVARDFLTGDPVPAGFWNDVGDATVGDRLYHGSGSLISISSLAGKGDLTLPKLTITLSGVEPGVNDDVRGASIAQTPIEVHLGIFDPATHMLIPPLIPYFIGFIDDCSIPTPPAGGDSAIVITCRSTSSALNKAGTATRSQASCAERDPDDGFYNYTGAVRGRPLYFGRKAPADAASGALS